jgi:hypothetical protein
MAAKRKAKTEAAATGCGSREQLQVFGGQYFEVGSGIEVPR